MPDLPHDVIVRRQTEWHAFQQQPHTHISATWDEARHGLRVQVVDHRPRRELTPAVIQGAKRVAEACTEFTRREVL